jgi:hypothetical protein
MSFNELGVVRVTTPNTNQGFGVSQLFQVVRSPPFRVNPVTVLWTRAAVGREALHAHARLNVRC